MRSLLIALAALPFCLQAADPELPRVYLDHQVESSGKKIVASTADALKKAISAALPGDTILLEPGAAYVGNFTLPPKPASKGWITIRSRGEIPAENTRVIPRTGTLPRLESPNEQPAISVPAGSARWRLLGVEVTTSHTLNWNILHTYSGSRDVIVDRCYVHGTPKTRTMRGVLLEGDAIAVVNSHISEIHYDGFDSQAIGGSAGMGPYKIANNYIEGAGENVMFGGARSKGVPSDIEVRSNYFKKRPEWEQNTPEWDGSKWTIKNLFELKNAQRVLVEGNVFDGNWIAAQGGVAILFTVATGQSGCQAVVNDITFRNNIIRNTIAGFSLLGRDYGVKDDSCRGQMRRVRISGNLIVHRNSKQAYHAGWVTSGDIEDVVMADNTFAWSGPVRFGVFFSGRNQGKGLALHRNVMAKPALGDSAGYGADALNKYMGSPSPWKDRYTGHIDTEPDPFVDSAGGNWRLKRGRKAGTDIDALEAMEKLVVQVRK
jgi:hypothetical protein